MSKRLSKHQSSTTEGHSVGPATPGHRHDTNPQDHSHSQHALHKTVTAGLKKAFPASRGGMTSYTATSPSYKGGKTGC